MKTVHRQAKRPFTVHRFLLLIICCLPITCTFAQAYQEQEIIVLLETEASWEVFEQDLKNTDFINNNFNKNTFVNDDNNNWLQGLERISKVMNIGILTIREDLDELEIAAALLKLKEVKATQLNYFAAYRSVPNDNLYQQQWNMDIINATTAWDFTTGGISPLGDTIVVFVIDEGIDLLHEDLVENIWINHAEIRNNGIDEDNNNYIDDYYGWYLTGNSDQHLPATHGVSVSGIIGAEGNNDVGISGVNWRVKILPFSIAESQLTAANILTAYDYALEMRQRYDASNGAEGAYVVVTNLSAGFSRQFPSSFGVFCEVYNTLGNQGILSVSATGNNENVDVEIEGDIPTLCESDFLITVTDTDSSDSRKGAFGRNTVDLAAPGASCFTTRPIDNYGYFSGTSCAAPHVTGTIALMYSLNNELFGNAIENNKVETALNLKGILLESTDKIGGLKNATLSGGRLNVGKAIGSLSVYYEGWNDSFSLLNVYPNPVDNLLTVTYKTPNINNFELLLYNSVGQLVLNNQYEVEEVGFKRVELNMDNFEAGIYFLIIKNREVFELTKIVVY